jgi:hypothetical protein
MKICEIVNINLKPQRKLPKAIPTQVIPEPLKRQNLVTNMANQIARSAQLPVPTSGDISAAVDQFEIAQKRANRAYKNYQKWADIRRRRMAKHSLATASPKYSKVFP